MEFYKYPPKPWEEVQPPNCDEKARDLVSKLVQYESSTRLTAAEVGLGIVPCGGLLGMCID